MVEHQTQPRITGFDNPSGPPVGECAPEGRGFGVAEHDGLHASPLFADCASGMPGAQSDKAGEVVKRARSE